MATAKDAEKFLSEVEDITKGLDDEKKAKSSLERKVTRIKNESEKEIKALKEEVAKLKEENAKVEVDAALKKEIEEMKKELAALKAQVKAK